MNTHLKKVLLAMLVTGICTPAAHAFRFENDSVQGSLNSTFTLGFGKRVQGQDCSHHGDISTSCGGNANTAVWANGDDGNLNYDNGDFFSTHIKGSHELLLSFEDDLRFMGRVGWLYDFTADDTARTPLDRKAKRAVGEYVRLYDLWVSKGFDMGGNRARVRVGNQTISWGESLFMFGGVNSNVAMDLQRLSSPGVQLKEAFLPSPLISFASGLGNGVNVEAYYQFKWDPYEFPPAGTYFSVADTFDRGRDDLLYFAPDAASFYYQRYHDKTPNVQYWNGDVTGTRMYFEKNRDLFGISANTSIGNWAVGAELSYRPKDAVALGVCMNMDGSGDGLEYGVECNSSIDSERYQLHLTGILSLTPGDHGAFLDLVGAQTATFLGELTAIMYPGVHKNKIYTRNQNGVAYQQMPAA